MTPAFFRRARRPEGAVLVVGSHVVVRSAQGVHPKTQREAMKRAPRSAEAKRAIRKGAQRAAHRYALSGSAARGAHARRRWFVFRVLVRFQCAGTATTRSTRRKVRDGEVHDVVPGLRPTGSRNAERETGTPLTKGPARTGRHREDLRRVVLSRSKEGRYLDGSIESKMACAGNRGSGHYLVRRRGRSLPRD